MITKIKTFFSEVKVELQKCSWPWDPKERGFRKYKELSDSTVVVVISMVLLGGFVSFFDFVLVNVVHFFTRLH
ncbi:MAG: preprotein translocase subunit SecE [Verrucomicrobia bacterium]|jgi:preprotein translocase subunit SecE|nr:MAG: preprotein translocase subunit SecE [Verrucomicrobiota bacterium]PYJ30521.1 MAG: preprotein translocase subunit SecE [Verrucomicrobiota bacterium]PYJ45980.1 MAG: preprotein translocase subunit SecE [Verrucomicrobiota bacterium]PYL53677.1 MAG: preprotein translocase subunit SecE [Verrucomicrobiota bacterium]